MGIRSDIGIAIKEELFTRLSTESVKLLDEFETKLRDEEGRLFHLTDVKWYRHEADISEFYKELYELDEGGEDYLIVEACHDYPTNEEGDVGGWIENPWGLVRNVSVSVEFCE